jgi:hypothetical protein
MRFIMSNWPADKREKRLRNLTDILSKYDRRDMRPIMGELSLEFFRQAALAEGYVNDDNTSSAEGHRLIAEAIHHVLQTLEAKRRESVEVNVDVEVEDAPSITDTVTENAKERGF